MEKKENKRNMLSGFFDNCKDLYLDGSKQEIGSNPLEQFEEKPKKQKDNSAEAKLRKIKRIILE